MKAVFIESTEFTNWLPKHLPDEQYARLQQELMEKPDRGDVMPGCGGLRKVRMADAKRGKGKRGGVRIIYLYAPDAKWFFMLDGYGKAEQDDLTTAEKNVLSKLAGELKQQAKAATRSRSGKRQARSKR